MHQWNHFYNTEMMPSITVQSNESIWPSAIGAFLGAFFAFGFGLVTFYLQKKLERYWKHKNSIVEIEHLLQDNLDQNAANIFLLKGAIETLKKNHLAFTLLTPLRLSDDISLRIGDIETLNKYFDYKEPVIKVNHGMQTWQGMNMQLHETVMSNPNLPPPIVHKNMDHLQEQAESLIKFMSALDTDTTHLLGYIRVYLRKDKHLWSKWLFRKQNKNASFVSDKEIKDEVSQLEKEVEEISTKSRERINKIING